MTWRRALAATDGDLRTTDGPPGDYHREQFGELCVYYCGALMLDRLRTVLGDELFAQVWREWPQQHRYGSVDRADYLAWLDRQLQELDKELDDTLRNSTVWREQADVLRNAKGVGPILTATLLSALPELGRLNHKEIAALVAQSQKRSAVFDIVTNPTDVTVTSRKA